MTGRRKEGRGTIKERVVVVEKEKRPHFEGLSGPGQMRAFFFLIPALDLQFVGRPSTSLQRGRLNTKWYDTILYTGYTHAIHMHPQYFAITTRHGNFLP
jgi:hypothetical protein